MKKINPLIKLIGVLLDVLDRGVPLPGADRRLNPLHLLLASALVAMGLSLGVWQVRRPVYADLPEQRFLIIHDSADPFGERCHRQTTKALDYAKMAYDSFDLSEAKEWPNLGAYSGLVFATELLDKLDEGTCRKIKEFVAGGGSLTVLHSGWNPHLGDLFGIANQPDFVETESGLRFEGDFFPGVKGLELPEEMPLPPHAGRSPDGR